MPDLQQQIRDAKKQSRQLQRSLAHEKADLARLTDVDRQLHAERDRKQNEISKANGKGHADALKQIVSILDGDIHDVRGRIHDHRDMRKKNRDRLKVVRHRLTHLRHREHHGHGGVISGDGPDVSGYQGSVNWNAVATKCDFAIAKATEGLSYVDPTWSGARVDSMGSSLKARGAYHFGHPTNSPEAEAEHFVSAVKAAGGKFISYDDFRAGKAGFVGVLDFESAPYSESWAAAWGRRFHELTGVKALIYGGGYSLNPVIGALDEFDGVWIAGYPNYVWSGPDALIVLHQYTSSGSIPGVSGPCDVSHYLGG